MIRIFEHRGRTPENVVSKPEHHGPNGIKGPNGVKADLEAETRADILGPETADIVEISPEGVQRSDKEALMEETDMPTREGTTAEKTKDDVEEAKKTQEIITDATEAREWAEWTAGIGGKEAEGRGETAEAKREVDTRDLAFAYIAEKVDRDPSFGVGNHDLKKWVHEKTKHMQEVDREIAILTKREDQNPDTKKRMNELAATRDWLQREIEYQTLPWEAAKIHGLAFGDSPEARNTRRFLAKDWGVTEDDIAQAFDSISKEMGGRHEHLQSAIPEHERRQRDALEQQQRFNKSIKNPELRIQDMAELAQLQARAGDFTGAEMVLRHLPKDSPERYETASHIAQQMLERGVPLPEAIRIIDKEIKNPEAHDGAIIELSNRSKFIFEGKGIALPRIEFAASQREIAGGGTRKESRQKTGLQEMTEEEWRELKQAFLPKKESSRGGWFLDERTDRWYHGGHKEGAFSDLWSMFRDLWKLIKYKWDDFRKKGV